MKRIRTIRTIALVAGAVVLAPALVAAETLTWDQAKVSELAKQLSVAITEVRTVALKEPALRDREAPNRRAADQYLSTLKRLETSCRQLARKLEAGEDREQTMGVARKIGTQLRDAQEFGRRSMTTEQQWLTVDPAVALINQLSPYYSDESPLLPVVTNR
jgi:3-methyladenine DNA glycosylase AlkD